MLNSYIEKAQDAITSRNKVINYLLYHKKIPEDPFNDKMIQDILLEITFSKHTQILRETPGFATDLVATRNYSLLHGITLLPNNVNGDTNITSKISVLATAYVSELLKIMGIKNQFYCCILPVATGMSLIFSMMTFRALKPKANYVIWSRIDQKSCFKSIISAGFTPIIIDTKCEDEEFITDVALIENKIQEIGAENINCLMTTTSCFAPRGCDEIEKIADICDRYNIYHLINNAYGLSNRKLMKRIHRASLKGRIDIFTQSTDKNLGVPVGGAIVASFNPDVFCKFTEICAETMSINAAVDVLLTFLSIGKKKYIEMIDDCEIMYKYLKNEMSKLANKYGEHIIENQENPISIAMTLCNIPQNLLTEIGSMLYTRNVSGVRVVTTREVKTICNFTFKNWGAHSTSNCVPYLTAAASIGISRNDVKIFIDKLSKIFEILLNKKYVK